MNYDSGLKDGITKTFEAVLVMIKYGEFYGYSAEQMLEVIKQTSLMSLVENFFDKEEK